jgi:hypothetical protein
MPRPKDRFPENLCKAETGRERRGRRRGLGESQEQQEVLEERKRQQCAARNSSL